MMSRKQSLSRRGFVRGMGLSMVWLFLGTRFGLSAREDMLQVVALLSFIGPLSSFSESL